MSARIDNARLPSTHQRLLLHAILLDGDAALRAWQTWQTLESISTADAASVFVFPSLYQTLRKLAPNDSAVPKLRGVYRHTWARNELALEGVRRACEALSAAGISSLLLKGIPLLQLVYRDLGARMMVDTDVAIRRADFTVADRVLTGLGFRASPASPRGTLPPFVHAVMYRHSRWLEIDLHVDPLGVPCTPSALDGLWQRAQPLAGFHAAAPDLIDLFLLTLINGRKADANGRCRWIVDAMALLRDQTMSWNDLPQRATAFQVRPTIFAQLKFLAESFDAPIPAATLVQLQSASASPHELDCDRMLCQIDPKHRPLWAMLPQRWRQYRLSCAAANQPPHLWEFAQHCADYLTWQFDLEGVWQVPALLYRDAVKGH